MDRATRLKVFDHSYTSKGRAGDACTYCGVVSDTMDHIPPLSYLEARSAVDIDTSDLVKVPACSECNSILSGLPILSIKDRRKRVKDKLRSKYKSILSIPNWDEDELDEMDDRFAESIRAAVSVANNVRARLAWRR